MMDCRDLGKGSDGSLPTMEVDPCWTPVTHLSMVTADRGETVEDDDTWRQILFEFCQNTPIHALRQMTEPTPYVIRRLLWALVLVGGLALFLSQTVSSTRRYLSREVAVDMKVTYNDTLRYPAVTLCNQNAFRATRLADLGIYGAVTELFRHGSRVDTNTNATSLFPRRLSLEQLYISSAHHKNDLIASCWWDGKRCGPDDFEMTLTDFGVCYTFNGRKSWPVRTVSIAGAEHGLRLRVNIEQYEYSRGPHHGAGVRLLLHRADQSPRPARFAHLLPPGVHALVGVRFTQVHSLESPYGQCNDRITLRYYTTYTKDNCMADCQQRFLLRRCGCRDVAMPAAHPKLRLPRVCNIIEYVSCLVPVLRLFNRMSRLCHCPPECARTLFDPTVTFGVNSNFNLEKTLQYNREPLQQKYINAREVSQRTNNVIVKTDERIVKALESSLMLTESICMEIHRTLTAQRNLLSKVLEETRRRVEFHTRRAMWGVKYQIKHSFIRGWKVRSESTIDHVTLGSHEIGRNLKRLVKDRKFRGKAVGIHDAYQLRLLLLENQLENKLYLVEDARRDFIMVNRSYSLGEALSSSSPFSVPVYDQSTLPTSILKGRIIDQASRFRDIVKHTILMERDLQQMIEIVEGMFLNESFPTEILDRVVDNYESNCRKFDHLKFIITDRIVEYPLIVINKKIDKFLNINLTLHQHFGTVYNTASELLELLNITHKGYWQHIQHLIGKYRSYLSNSTMLKTDLYTASMAGSLVDSVRNITRFFNTVRIHSAEHWTALRYFQHTHIDFYRLMYQEPTTKALYRMIRKHLHDLQANQSMASYYIPIFEKLTGHPLKQYSNLDDIFSIMKSFISRKGLVRINSTLELHNDQLLSQNDVIAAINSAEEDFKSAFSDLELALRTHHEGNKLDGKFYKENFLSLDIFLRELCFTEISQQVAYDANNLWGDIGGSIGLFVGASIITVFEVVDVFVYNAFRFALKKDT